MGIKKWLGLGGSGEDVANQKSAVPGAGEASLYKVGPDSGPAYGKRMSLASGEPLYYALLKDPNPLVIKPDEANEAKSLLSRAQAHNPAEVNKCQGLTREAAARVLRDILTAADEADAAANADAAAAAAAAANDGERAA